MTLIITVFVKFSSAPYIVSISCEFLFKLLLLFIPVGFCYSRFKLFSNIRWYLAVFLNFEVRHWRLSGSSLCIGRGAGWVDLTRGRLRAMCPFYLKNSKCQHLQAFSLGLLNLCRESSNLMTGEKGHIMLACRHCGNQQKKKVEEGWPHGSACRLQFIRLVLERHLTHAFLSLAHCAWS